MSFRLTLDDNNKVKVEIPTNGCTIDELLDAMKNFYTELLTFDDQIHERMEDDVNATYKFVKEPTKPTDESMGELKELQDDFDNDWENKKRVKKTFFDYFKGKKNVLFNVSDWVRDNLGKSSNSWEYGFIYNQLCGMQWGKLSEYFDVKFKEQRENKKYYIINLIEQTQQVPEQDQDIIEQTDKKTEQIHDILERDHKKIEQDQELDQEPEEEKPSLKLDLPYEKIVKTQKHLNEKKLTIPQIAEKLKIKEKDVNQIKDHMMREKLEDEEIDWTEEDKEYQDWGEVDDWN